MALLHLIFDNPVRQVLLFHNLTNEEKYELLTERFENELKELQEKDTLTEKEFQSVISIINSLKDSTATDFESLKTEIINQLTNNKELSDEEIAAVKKALEDMAEQNKKDLSDFKKYLEDEVVPGIQQTINENTQNIENNTNARKHTIMLQYHILAHLQGVHLFQRFLH